MLPTGSPTCGYPDTGDIGNEEIGHRLSGQ